MLKPDLVICRLFHRLGLLGNERQSLKAVIEGHKFAAATKLPIRYIDIVLAKYGQVATPKLGIAQGVCLDKPRCDVCSIRQHCTHPAVTTAF